MPKMSEPSSHASIVPNRSSNHLRVVSSSSTKSASYPANTTTNHPKREDVGAHRIMGGPSTHEPAELITIPSSNTSESSLDLDLELSDSTIGVKSDEGTTSSPPSSNPTKHPVRPGIILNGTARSHNDIQTDKHNHNNNAVLLTSNHHTESNSQRMGPNEIRTPHIIETNHHQDASAAVVIVDSSASPSSSSSASSSFSGSPPKNNRIQLQASSSNLTQFESLPSKPNYAASTSSGSSSSISSSSPMSSGTDEPTTKNTSSSDHQRVNHHHPFDQNNHSCPTSTTIDVEMDTRKVEPLKINLQYREPIKTIIKLPKNIPKSVNYENNGTIESTTTTTTTPKITIKPLVKPDEFAKDSPATISPLTIPRLTLRVDNSDGNSNHTASNNHSLGGQTPTNHVEPHIVPKLTIRTASAQSEIVPKLTIAYNHATPAAAAPSSFASTTTTSGSPNVTTQKILEDGTKLTIRPVAEPPIPKMTIKANEIVTAPSTPPTSKSNQSTEPSPTPAVPKIKIKQINKAEETIDGAAAAHTFAISRTPTIATEDKPQTVPKLLVRVPKDTEPTEAPSPEIPKLTIRQVVKPNAEPDIVIPKVTIRPIINPDQLAAESETLITPKITIKPIPKPVDLTQPLEIVTSGDSFVSSIPDSCNSSDSQQSPRIILKINKATPASPLTLDSIDQNTHIISSSNDLKRPSSVDLTTTSPEGKKFRPNVMLNNHVPEPITPNHPISAAAPDVRSLVHTTQPPAEESKLKEILTRMHQLPAADAPTPTPSRKMQTNSSVRRPVRPPPSSHSDNAITLPPEMEFAASQFREEPVTKPVRLHPLLLQNIERAKLLESMMNAAEPKPISSQANDQHSTDNDNHQHNHNSSAPTLSSLCSEGSSSDCVIIEPPSNGAATTVNLHPFAVVGKKNGPVSAFPSDQDSGVDVFGLSADGTTPAGVPATTPAKRGRGRPRKDATPGALSAAKPSKEEKLAKRRFIGVLMSERKTPGRKRKNPLPDALTGLTPTVTPKPGRGRKKLAAITRTDIIVLSPFNDEITNSADEPIANAQDPLDTTTAAPTNNTFVATINHTCTLNSVVPTHPEPKEAAQTAEPPAISASSTVSPYSPLKNQLKERKRRIRIDDDDESPTFSPVGRSNRRGRGRGGRGSRGGRLFPPFPRTPNKIGTGSSESMFPLGSPSRDSNEPRMFPSPESSNVFVSPPEGKNQRNAVFNEVTAFNSPTAVVQASEDDTRMSADGFTTPLRISDPLQNEESQSSLISTTTTTVTATGDSSASVRKRGRIEVADAEGKTDFTVDMIAEYDWPPPKGCCPARNRDTYMIQEQVAEYLDVKSFKRKYPDLPRRMVEMEERNYLSEKGLVSEKMCDLGLTAVLASDILDIMHNDFFDKYDEYKKYLRINHIRQITYRTKAQIQLEAAEKNLSARERCVRMASVWNREFNRDRIEERQQFLDLQNMVIHFPEVSRKKMVGHSEQTTASHYPVALVPGQFQEYYRTFSAAELLCYPINTALADPIELDRKLRAYSERRLAGASKDVESDESSSDGSDDSSGSGDDSSSSDDDDSDSDSSSSMSASESERVNTDHQSSPKHDGKCRVCDKPQHINRDNKPEVFVMCATCRRRAHPSCIEMPPRMSMRVQDYDWQCTDCKHCSKCRQNSNEDKMLFCDQCDRGYHIYCIGLNSVPEGRWHCHVCSICTLCGTRSPEGHKNPNLTAKQRQRLISTAKWSHEYRISHVSNLREHSAMLCTPCVQQRQSSPEPNVMSLPNSATNHAYTTVLSPQQAAFQRSPSTTLASHSSVVTTVVSTFTSISSNHPPPTTMSTKT